MFPSFIFNVVESNQFLPSFFIQFKDYIQNIRIIRRKPFAITCQLLFTRQDTFR